MAAAAASLDEDRARIPAGGSDDTTVASSASPGISTSASNRASGSSRSAAAAAAASSTASVGAGKGKGKGKAPTAAGASSKDHDRVPIKELVAGLMGSTFAASAEELVRRMPFGSSGHEAEQEEALAADAMPLLVAALADEETAELAARAMAGLLSCGSSPTDDIRAAQAAVKHGAVPALAARLSSEQADVAFQALQGVAKGDDECKLACIEAGVVPFLETLIMSSTGSDAAEAGAMLRSFALGRTSSEAAVITALVNIMSSSPNDDDIKWAADSLQHIARNDPKHDLLPYETDESVLP